MHQQTHIHNESYVLPLIDYFIKDVCYGNYSDYESFKAQLSCLIPSFKPIYNPNLYCINTVQVFCEIINLVDHIILQNGWKTYEDISRFDESHIFHISGWIMSYQNKIQQQIHNFSCQEQKNLQSLNMYISTLIERYARLLFVRVDLSILQEYQCDWSIQTFNQALSTLLNRIANQDTCFADLRGYAWALEQGLEKGYHVHLLLIYDGNKHQQDSALGMLVGNYWCQITNGHGTYFNCNTTEHKQKFEVNDKLGIGMIYRNNEQQVSNALYAASYLVNPEKENQYLRVKNSTQMRTFGKGQL